MEAVGTLAGGIAHDFNNLVTVINGHARFALDELPAGHVLQPDLEEIERAGIRAAGLTQQLLAFSRRQLLRPQVLELNAVVRELDSMLVRLIGEHIQLRSRIGATDDRVRVDRGQLEQVLMNLVVNARDAMPDGGILLVETAALEILPDDPRVESWELEPGYYVRLEVSDTGTGMDPATLECAFEPFFTTKERGKGTGLGLATVFGIVKQSGGHVVAVSTPGEGSTFSVVLPLADEAIDATHEPLRPCAVPASQEGRTILVVEDEDAVRKLAVRVLERGGYHVLAATDGQAALDLLDHDDATIDLVLSDVIMPRMGGRELTAEVARRFPHVPVVLMSGYDEEPFSDDAGLPGSDFIAKPFTPHALATQIDATLRRQPSPGGSFRRPADRTLDSRVGEGSTVGCGSETGEQDSGWKRGE
jgi:CheY-like chemotaxis protein